MHKKLNILMACFPADGHFKPLTGIAKHLASCGHDVRWYASREYTKHIQGLHMHHYPFRIAKDAHASLADVHFPDRKKIKNPIRKLSFDMIHFFIERGEEYMQDISELRKNFSPDIVVCDIAFSGIPYIKDCLHLPVVSVSVFPFPGSAPDLPPYGFGLTPAHTLAGKLWHHILRGFASRVLFKKSTLVMHKALEQYQIAHNNASIFDIGYTKSDLVLQSGSPSFDYQRKTLDKRVKFVGAVLPYRKPGYTAQWYDARLGKYKTVVLVTQGTVEKDATKLLIPTLNAFKNDKDTLVICTTGYGATEALRAKYNTPNIIIEDFISFENVLPYTDVFISNGGYGGVLMGIAHTVPMIVGGVHEGKNEICARIGYLKYGINLGTERPKAAQIKTAVKSIFNNPMYKCNITRLAEDFNGYNTNRLAERYINVIAHRKGTKKEKALEAEIVYP